MSLNFDFLKNVELNAPSKKTATRTTADKNPTGGLYLRVFGSGKIYPSQELVDKFYLEYPKKDAATSHNGLDVFKSVDWPMYPSNSKDHFVFIAPVPKNSPKVDLFGQVGYEADGTPKNSVMEQGGGSFGPTIIEMIKEVYGIEIPKGEYKDFEVKSDIVVKSPNDIYYMPKKVMRGEKKGEITVVRRENVDVMPLAPLEEDSNEVQPESTDESPIENVEQDVEQTEESPAFQEDTPFDTTGPGNSVDTSNIYPEVPSDESEEENNDMPNIPNL